MRQKLFDEISTFLVIVGLYNPNSSLELGNNCLMLLQKGLVLKLAFEKNCLELHIPTNEFHRSASLYKVNKSKEFPVLVLHDCFGLFK